MSELNKVLEERGNEYGDFECIARTVQAMKILMNSGAQCRTPRSDAQQEAIDMICHKLARLAWGDNSKKDTWLDIAGYATLIVNILEKEKFQK